ncbi:SWIM zinc finger family protein [Streptomyces sp. NPDC001356]
MRHYLATAFRMPTWSETPEEPEEHASPTTAGQTPSASASAPPSPASGPSDQAPAVRTPALPTEPSASAPSAPGPSTEVPRTTPSTRSTPTPTPTPSEHTYASSALAPASSEHTPPPSGHTPAPSGHTCASSASAPAPSEPTPASSGYTPSPSEPTSASSASTPPPPASTPASSASTPASTGSTPGPSASTSVSLASTSVPPASGPGPSERAAAHPDPAGPFARWTPAAQGAAAGGASAPAGPSEASAHPGPGPGTPHSPAAPQTPTTMAAPHRDSELRRTFPAFAPRGSAGGDEAFAGTWWGNAWVGALEQGALDAKRLARGRGYADQGHVDAITVTPGLVLAYVRGSRPRPYRVQVRVRTLEDEDWERFLDAAADRPGHIAALLDKELPQSLADCGVPLLPGPGDLGPRCSCPDSGHPCKHAAALCYQTARLLDADPFVLLLLRGRGERELLDALSRRSAARAAHAARERQPRTLPGVRAADALAPRELPPPPPPLPLPPHPEQPPVYPSAPGGPDPFALDQLATDAAARAHALLATGRDPVGELTLWQDAVRLAAARPGSGLTAATRTLYATLADAAHRTPADLARAVAAWRQGGAAGLAALEEPWDPPAGRFDRARPLLLAADLPAFRPWRNRLTHPRGHVQLRLGRDGLWYAYESEPGQDDWWPRGTPDLDPVGALTGLGVPDDVT